MEKIRLDLNALDVESFPTSDEGKAARGTVRGQESTGSYFTLGHDSCYGGCDTREYDTCNEASCTVGPSCEYFCTAQSVGCSSGPETELC